MPVFTYKAMDPRGARTSGALSAQSRSAALEQVARKGLVPVSVNEQQAARAAGRSLRLGGNRVPQTIVEAFSRELANLLAAGVAMIRALSILRREASHPAARKQWAAIHDDVAEGMPLADAMGKWPRSFPAVNVAMVRAGETGGFLDVVLTQIADLQSRQRNLRSKIRSAFAYPAVLGVLATGVLIFLLTYFIPRFSSIFMDFGSALPSLTRAIVAISEAVLQYGLLIVLGVAVIAILVHRVLKSPSGRRMAERAILRIPAVGAVVARFALVRFCRMLGTLLGAGVPLVTSLRVAREAIGNETLADAVHKGVEQVQQGRSLARSLAGSEKLFPASVVEMIAVAEETGRLDAELKRLALVYEEELDRQLRMLVALAEPVLLFVMAGIVGTIVVGMLLPIFTLQELIR
ncbi:MAG TPA: type II secretion system F family protein [Phycisphaerae bacterium]|nr:type II secretion system F family protein [Phycisphaerae bacterium]